MSNHCFHCGLPNPADPQTLTFDGTTYEFCCTGCQCAAKTILDSGLGEYYKFHQPDQHPVDADISTQTKRFDFYDKPEVQHEFVTNNAEGLSECLLSIEGISCSACSWLIEKRVQQLDGIASASVNASTHRLSVTWKTSETPLSDIFKAIFLIGYKAAPFSADEEERIQQTTQRKYILRLGIAGIGMMQAMMNAVALYSGAIEEQHEIWLWWTSLFLTLPVIFVSAWPFFTSAWNNLKAKHLSMDVSVSLAILSAFGASCYATVTGHGEVYFESVNMFTFFLVLTRFLEFRARRSVYSGGNALTSNLPQIVHRRDGSETVDTPLNEVKANDILVIMAGDVCPVDGTIVEGNSEFDESSFTGEFKPVSKQTGDRVSAGTVNKTNPIAVSVTENANHAFNFLETLIERGASEKSRLAELIDKGARQFIWSTLVISLLIGLVWLWVDPSRAFWIVVSVLVVTCPCALSLATPSALAQASLNLKQQGFIVTKGYVLERLASATNIAFDKTGTLTEGQFRIHHLEQTEPDDSRLFTDEHLLSVAACLEESNHHPIAEAFRHIALPSDRMGFRTIEHIPGFGVKGENSEGIWTLGKPEAFSTTEEQTILELKRNDGILARFVLDDKIRSTTPTLFDQLKKLKLVSHVLTGDPNTRWQSTLKEIQLSGDYQSNCSAGDKVSWVQNKAKQDSLIMVGDGLNDAPVLASAPLSIAMLNATDMTKSQADVLMLTHDLQIISSAIQLARKTKRIIRQNLAWALVYNGVALPLAAVGWVTPWQAAIGMSLSSLVVVGNALRLRKR